MSVDVSASLPLSESQRSLWFLYQLGDALHASHNVGFCVQLHGALSAEVVEIALQRVVSRHPMLRTSFEVVDGEPQQVVHDYVRFALQRLDARSLDAERLEACVGADFAVCFDLAAAPLMRGHWYERGDGEAVLLLVFDHLACDGASYWQLIQELGEEIEGRYEAPADSGSFEAFLAWQRDWLSGPTAEASWAYWRQQLAGAIARI